MIQRSFIVFLYCISFSSWTNSFSTLGQLLKKLPPLHPAFFLTPTQRKARIIFLQKKVNYYLDPLLKKGFSMEKLHELAIVYEEISNIKNQLKNKSLSPAIRKGLFIQWNEFTNQEDILLREKNIINPQERKKVRSIIKEAIKINYQLGELYNGIPEEEVS